MSRPSRQATCHPEKKHRAHGLCNNCYINSRHRTPEGRKKRHEYYLRIRDSKIAKSKANYQKDRPRQVRLGTIRSAKSKARHRVNRPKPEVSLQALPRETPKDSIDREWWKPKANEIPKRWRLNT